QPPREVFERGDHVVRQVGVDELSAVVQHLLEQGLPQSEQRAALDLQLRQPGIDHPPGKARGVEAQDLYLARFGVYLHLAGCRGVMPVDRADALSGLRIEAAAGSEGALSEQVAAARPADHIGVAATARSVP